MNLARSLCSTILVLSATASVLLSQTLTTLHDFNGSDSENPQAALLEATNGELYGTAGNGGADAEGSAFKITRRGELTIVYSFCSQPSCADGAVPVSSLVQAPNGVLYGTTSAAGAHSFYAQYGTIFKLTPGGSLTTLYSFCSQSGCADGAGPVAGLVRGSDGNLYGTTGVGGINTSCSMGCGTVFQITPSGALTTLYNFCSQPNCADGSAPQAGLIRANDGNLYGTTRDGGANSQGTIFRITTAGALTTIYNFCSLQDCADGSGPEAALVQGGNGNLYGAAKLGGSNCAPQGCGTLFQITLGGQFTTLYSFCAQANCADGQYPSAGLIQATDGNLYGATRAAGANSNVEQYGTLFRITTGGALTTLYSFCSKAGCADGAAPVAALVQATDGNFYGTTLEGGTYGSKLGGWGTIFRLSAGFSPFVKTAPGSGAIGTDIQIQGDSLTGTTSVSFHGTPAAFTIGSNGEISATVPAGATSGKLEVTTPSGTLLSNVPFQVRQ